MPFSGLSMSAAFGIACFAPAVLSLLEVVFLAAAFLAVAMVRNLLFGRMNGLDG
jgi:hypothetical protein